MIRTAEAALASYNCELLTQKKKSLIEYTNKRHPLIIIASDLFDMQQQHQNGTSGNKRKQQETERTR